LGGKNQTKIDRGRDQKQKRGEGRKEILSRESKRRRGTYQEIKGNLHA